MIIEFLINGVVSLFSGLISAVSLVSLPSDLITSLSTVISYGSWIVGSDLMLTFATCIYVWTGLRITIGLVTFIWKMLPLT